MSGLVLHVVMTWGAVSQTFVRDSIQSLADLGWSPEVAAQEILVPDERVHLLRAARCSRLGAVGDRLRRRPWNGRVLDVGSVLDAVRPDLVHAHLGRAAVYAAPASMRRGIPFLPSFHGWDVTVLPEDPAFAKAYRWLFGRIPRVHTVSRFLEGRLRERGYAGHIDIVPAGVRLDAFPFREPRPHGPVRFLFVGRLVEYKGLDVLLRAFPQVVAVHPDATLDVVGDGPLLRESRSIVQDLRIEGSVTFHGARMPAAVAAHMREADVLVVPSRDVASGQAEGSPVVTKEALATGLQVVTTRNGGLPETIPPAMHDELLTGRPSAATLAEAMLRLASHRDQWPARARIGREWVEAEFDWRRLASRLALIYEELSGRAASTV